MDVVNDMMKQLPKSDKKNYEKEVAKVLKTMGVKSEEADLDEATNWKMGDGKPRGGSNIENVRFWDLSKDELQYIMKDAGAAMKANPTAKKATSGPGNYADQVNDATTVLGWRKKNGIKEDVELDELMPATKHVAKSKKNPDMFCVFDKDGNEVKLFKDKKDAEEYAIKNHDALNEEADLDEASARSDAKRSMSRDKDLSRKGSSLDKDDFATDDDVKAASKNIMMQLRKAANLRGTFAVEFGDKKKVKVDPKVAQAAASKYNSLRRPADKEKFQMQIAKSYKDMLGAIKESTVKESKFDTINKQLKGEK
jgi:hypothetical protein